MATPPVIARVRRGVARILGEGVLEYVCMQNLSHAHLLTVRVEVQIVKENDF